MRCMWIPISGKGGGTPAAAFNRNVWLMKTDPVAVDLWGVFLPVGKRDATSWNVPLEVTVRNITYETEALEIRTEILSPGREVVAEIRLSGSVPPRDTVTLTGSAVLDSPLLWDLDAPNLYTAKVTVSKRIGGAFRPCDVYEQRFGFREIVMTADRGLFLNGREHQIERGLRPPRFRSDRESGSRQHLPLQGRTLPGDGGQCVPHQPLSASGGDDGRM